MSAKEELRRIILTHCDPQYTATALRLLDSLTIDERRRSEGDTSCEFPLRRDAASQGIRNGLCGDEEAFVELLTSPDENSTSHFVRDSQDGVVSAGNRGHMSLISDNCFPSTNEVTFPALGGGMSVLGNGNMQFYSVAQCPENDQGNVLLGWSAIPVGANVTWGTAALSKFPDHDLNQTGMKDSAWSNGFTSAGWNLSAGSNMSITGNGMNSTAGTVVRDISVAWVGAIPESQNSESRLLGPSLLLPGAEHNEHDLDESFRKEQKQPKFSSVVGTGAKSTPRKQQLQTGDSNKREDQSRAENAKRSILPRASTPKMESRRYDAKRVDVPGPNNKHGQGLVPKVKLRGLPYGATVNDVTSFFRGYGAIESSVVLGYNSDGRPSGEGWVSFSRLEDAKRAVREKDRHHMRDRYVELFLLNEGGGVVNKSTAHPR